MDPIDPEPHIEVDRPVVEPIRKSVREPVNSAVGSAPAYSLGPLEPIGFIHSTEGFTK